MLVKIKEEKSKTVAKRWLWAIYSFVILALLLFALVLFADNWLANKLQSTVKEKSHGVYTLHMQDVHLRLFAGEVRLDSVRLHPDIDKWKQLPDSSQMQMLYKVEVESISLNGINVWNLISDNPIKLGLLHVQKPELIAYRMKPSVDKSDAPLHTQVPKRLQGFKLDSVRISSANLFFKSSNENSYNDMAMLGFNLSAGKISLDSASYQDDSRLMYAKSVVADVDESNFLTEKGFYRIKTSSVSMSSISGRLEIKDVKLVPLYSAAEMSERAGEVVTWMEADVPSVTVEQVDFNALAKRSDYIAHAVLIQSPALYAFADYEHYERKGTKALPHQLVQDMKKALAIDSIQVKGFNLKYEEIAEGANSKGSITFENSDVLITNLSNLPERISREHPAVVHASTKVQGKAPLDFTIHLPLLDKNSYHRIYGSIGAFKPEIFNSIIEPSAFITVEHGQVHSGKFDMELNASKATGSILILYNDFEVELLSKKEDVRQTLGNEIVSEVINWVAIKKKIRVTLHA
ncbi:hypothetical protein GCM10028895_06400 [Pontibacter rugosus]